MPDRNKPMHPLLRPGEGVTEALERQGAEIVRLQALVRDAYNEAFGEGMREHMSRGGKPWDESRARTALAGKSRT